MKPYKINCACINEDFISLMPSCSYDGVWIAIKEEEVVLSKTKIKELIKELNKYLEE
ncbi:hypothetical protein [uncultured Mediterranean phage uvMED]|nr:hypothetical protein [uncultured Mediterranean phage uvMED]